MNMILCGESCRWQKDGICTLEDLSCTCDSSARCRYFSAASK